MIAPEITDRALLRWMERVHGIDVEGWRALMRAEVEDALRAYEGRRHQSEAAYVVNGPRVVTTLGPGQVPRLDFAGSAYVPRLP